MVDSSPWLAGDVAGRRFATSAYEKPEETDFLRTRTSTLHHRPSFPVYRDREFKWILPLLSIASGSTTHLVQPLAEVLEAFYKSYCLDLEDFYISPSIIDTVCS
jgi:hypothetical protein